MKKSFSTKFWRAVEDNFDDAEPLVKVAVVTGCLGVPLLIVATVLGLIGWGVWCLIGVMF